MYKRLQSAVNEKIDKNENSSSDEINTSHQTITNIVRMQPTRMRKYVKRRRLAEDINISSDSSNDEQSEQENIIMMINNKPSSQNKFQALSVSVSAKKTTPSPMSRLLDTSNLTMDTPSTSRSAWQPLSTLTQTSLDVSLLEANLSTIIEKQPTGSARKSLSFRKKRRCIKGGYLQEYKRLIQKEHMNRRSLTQNQRLGISSGNRVNVLAMIESFGVHMARVQPVDTVASGVGNEHIFNVIVAPCMAANISIGSQLELYFDLNPTTALQLPNKQTVYIQPNNIVLL